MAERKRLGLLIFEFLEGAILGGNTGKHRLQKEGKSKGREVWEKNNLNTRGGRGKYYFRKRKKWMHKWNSLQPNA